MYERLHCNTWSTATDALCTLSPDFISRTGLKKYYVNNCLEKMNYNGGQHETSKIYSVRNETYFSIIDELLTFHRVIVFALFLGYFCLHLTNLESISTKLMKFQHFGGWNANNDGKEGNRNVSENASVQLPRRWSGGKIFPSFSAPSPSLQLLSIFCFVTHCDDTQASFDNSENRLNDQQAILNTSNWFLRICTETSGWRKIFQWPVTLTLVLTTSERL